ncbi:MAG: hypothetical protein C3F11_18430 [Methylocystaceae bacterium]|nr:MAG: hypothetical protein C3F11_18430 [Methylocystaceae bacterium]
MFDAPNSSRSDDLLELCGRRGRFRGKESGGDRPLRLRPSFFQEDMNIPAHEQRMFFPARQPWNMVRI